MAAAAMLAFSLCASAEAQTEAVLSLRGHPQALHLCGQPGHPPVVVSSGDGGWLHLAPQVAAMLVSRGYFVIGIDSKAYLESFTTSSGSLTEADVRADYHAIINYARQWSAARPLLVGVSEGAALSVLAATDDDVKRSIAGVIALGLGDRNELAWRWRDSVIYLTHGVPREPTFSVAAIIARVAPLPLAVINSSRDEYVPAAEIAHLVDVAREPKQFWSIESVDHRFSDRQDELRRRLIDAIAWIDAHTTPQTQ